MTVWVMIVSIRQYRPYRRSRNDSGLVWHTFASVTSNHATGPRPRGLGPANVVLALAGGRGADGTAVSARHERCVLGQRAGGVVRLRPAPRGSPARHLGVVDEEVKPPLHYVQDDLVAVGNKRHRTAVPRFRRDMPDARTERGPREPAVGEQRDVLAEPCTLDGRRDREHLAHAGTALGALVPDAQYVALADVAARHGLEAVLLALEHARVPLESQGLDARGLDDGAVRGERAAKDRQAAVGLERVLDRTHDLAVGLERVSHVVADGVAVDRHSAAVDQPGGKQFLQDHRNAADPVQLAHDEQAGGAHGGDN